MKTLHPARLACLALAAALIAAAAPAARASSITASVVLSTAGLTETGPFELYFQLNDGSGVGDGNNTLSLTNFSFGTGGSAGAIDAVYSGGAYSGDLSSGLSLSDTQPFNAVAAFFTPGDKLSFQLTDTFTSVDTPVPDVFAFAVIANGAAVSTDAGDSSDSLIEFNFDSPSAVPEVFADNSSGDNVGSPTVQVLAPQNVVPEPASLWLMASGLALLGLLRRRWADPSTSA